jgi:hypothetical protein
MRDIDQVNKIQLPDILDPDSEGVQASTTPDAMIEIIPAAGDETHISPADARKLADWLNKAADLCDLEVAKYPVLQKLHLTADLNRPHFP